MLKCESIMDQTAKMEVFSFYLSYNNLIYSSSRRDDNERFEKGF